MLQNETLDFKTYITGRILICYNAIRQNIVATKCAI